MRFKFLTERKKYLNSIVPYLIMTFFFSIYIYFWKGYIVSSKLFDGMLLVVLSRAFDTGMTYVGIKKGVGKEGNPDAEKSFKRYGYFGTFLLQSFILIFLFTFFYLYLPRVNAVAIYFVLLYWFVGISLIAGLRWTINIIRSM